MAGRSVGVLGLGNMGGGMVASLLRGGFEVTVFDPVTQLVQAAVKAGARAAASPAAVARACAVVCSSLPDPAAVEAAGARMVDCPVGRGPAEAASGDLILMAGGRAEDLDAVRDVLGALGKAVHHCGPAGAGAAAKLVNNLVSCAMCALNGEALVLAAKAGVDLDVMTRIMGSTAAANRHLEITAIPRTLDGDFAPRFRVALAEKDLRLAVQMGLELLVPTPMAAAAHGVHRLASALGHADEDQGAVIKVPELAAGVQARRRPT
jgi:3-hydroxyisobutyrate dehydrogenase-like beta-hydroxyacid dehydrogenase